MADIPDSCVVVGGESECLAAWQLRNGPLLALGVVLGNGGQVCASSKLATRGPSVMPVVGELLLEPHGVGRAWVVKLSIWRCTSSQQPRCERRCRA